MANVLTRLGIVLTVIAGVVATPQTAEGANLVSAPLKLSFGSTARAGFTTIDSSKPDEGSKLGCAIEGEVVQGAGSISSAKTFYLQIPLPREGNYRVTVTVGADKRPSSTTVKAELRRLMTGPLLTGSGTFSTRVFIVNTRTPRIEARNKIAEGVVQVKVPRETVQEAWAWDDALTLEFSGSNPSLATLEISPVEVPTLFLLGDSTVCDQPDEPYGTWGQMLPRWLTPDIAVANHAESGESLRSSIALRRRDKIVSLAKPGDVLMIQFGHNDQKQIADKSGDVASYKAELRETIAAFRAVGGSVVVLSSMERRKFDETGKVVPSLTDYANAARDIAKEGNLPFIDLNALSIALYQAMGAEKSALAFANPDGKQDNTHPNSYGGYELAQCVLQALRDSPSPLKRYISADFSGFSPAHPDRLSTFEVPPSPKRKQAETK